MTASACLLRLVAALAIPRPALPAVADRGAEAGVRAVYAPPFEAEREADRSTVAALERQAAAASGASPNSADSFFSGADSMKFLPFFALLMLGACATPSDEVRSARWENNAAMMDGAVPR